MTTSTTLVVRMKKRSNMPRLPRFGGRLRELRGDASRQEISNRLHGLNVPLGGSTIKQYEDGAVWSPDPTVLWGLSRIYKVSFEDLVLLLRTERARVSGEILSRDSNDVQKSDVTNTLGSVSASSITEAESARHVLPSATHNASGGSRRSRRSLSNTETEHRFEVIATRLENITETLAAFGHTLAATVAQQQTKPRGKATAVEGAPPRRRSSDR